MNHPRCILRAPMRAAALALLLAACSDGDTPPADVVPESGLEAHQQLARDILRELIEIDTTQAGNTTIAADAMAARLLAAGFPAEDVKVLGPTENRRNLVARLRGRDDGRKPILLLAHIDVVAADPADWSLDPFTFTESDGFFYGRGATDDKDEAAIHVANLIRMRREGFQPDRDIIVALTADEETGEQNGVKWLIANHPELINAEYALNEGGGGSLRDGMHIANNVQASEKVFQSFTLEVTNPGGHSSLPVKENAIYRLADALIRIRAHDFPVAINEVTMAFFERSAAIEDSELATAMRGVLQDPPDPSAIAYLSRLPYYNARLRTTCVVTRLQAGHAENALPQRAQATVNCRMLPTDSPQVVIQTLKTVINDEQVSVTPIKPAVPSPSSPLTPELLGAIEAVTAEMWPGVPVIPTMGTGATDGLHLRNAGIPVYGVSGLFGEVADNRAHGRDERILIKSFFEGQEFLYRLTTRLAKEDAK
ncbi:MAG: M20/M25/M40 family metallo-hydrolase [Gammaproteobacteria bacterium]|nr:M20/M25/M40 family metallo-hydrolase [Gammaproteobacteria bacterium]